VLKYASCEILDARMAGQSPGLLRNAHRVTFDYEPRPGYLYVRSRMISSRCNDNFDEFPPEEISKGYRTFIGKPVFVNHHNEDHRNMRGLIIDAALHGDKNPDGSPDTWAEGLMEVDALSYPKLAKAILLGHIERTSMGVDVEYSLCSKCGNKATTPLDYCAHIPRAKGIKYVSVTASGERLQDLIREKCFGLKFFENSLLVEDPADPTAYVLGKPVVGPGLEHLTSTLKVASKTAHVADQLLMGRISPSQMSQEDLWDTDVELARRAIALGKPGQVSKPHKKVRDEMSRRTATVSPAMEPQLGEDGEGYFVYNDHERSKSYPKPQGIPRQETDFINATGSLRLVAGHRCASCGGIDTIADLQGNQECGECGVYVEAAGPKYPDPQDHPFFQEHPVHPDNVLAHWDAATKDEKTSGKKWYPSAHLVAKGLSTLHPQGTVHMAAGMLANYSAQTPWEVNQHNAARALHGQEGVGGPGSGVFASNQQKKNADRLMKGENYNDVLGGPKIKDFAHLIEHGGDKDPAEPHVVIDRHALSVAANKRMTTAEYSASPLSTQHYYDHVVKTYADAADQLSKRLRRPVHGHEVQATTWLVRQRLNEASENEKAASGADTRLERGRKNTRDNAGKSWDEFRQHHMPTVQSPGTGYQKRSNQHVAYGETKAPADVDTLRDEACPVCGEMDSWDGNECRVCGFVSPPKEFQDPDLDVARQVDLRKDNADLDGTDVSDLNQQVNDVDRDGLDDNTGLPMGGANGEGDQQPMLTCPACNTEFEAGEPMSSSTTDPQVGASGDGPADGDVCPACGKGLLESGTELAETDPEDVDQSDAPPEEASAQEPAPGERTRGVEDDDADPDQPDDQEEQDDEDPDADQDKDPDGPPAKKKPRPFK
jgi:hypothetical protein